MAPLISLDLRRLAAQSPIIVVMLVFGLAPRFLIDGGGSTGIAFVAMAGVVAIIRLFPFDDANRSYTLTSTLPVTRRQVIASRFLVSLGLVVVAMGVLVIASPDLSPAGLAPSALIAVAMLLNLVVTAPMASRGGFGAYGPVLPMFVFALVMMGIVFMPPTWQVAIAGFALANPVLALGLGLVILVALVAGSFLLSVRFFERRDL